MSDDRQGLDLTECDLEPIHIPGRIQPFGYLIACAADTWVVTHVSENVVAEGLLPPQALGHPLRSLIGSEAFHALANAMASSTGPSLPGRVFNFEWPGGKRFNAAIHSYLERNILELEPAALNYDAAAPFFLVRSMLMRLQQAENVEAVCAIAVQQLRTLIDFDRVMIYRFLQDGSGSVIAESRVESVPSFLEHHYPATDIPKQARDLYLKNWIRLIADVEAMGVPVVGNSGDPAPLDMSYCALRSVSPIHIEYLKNMRVSSSLSISIVVGGSLWGLIACHNGTPRVVPPDIRVAAEFFGQAFSLQLQTLVRADVADMLREARERIDRIVAALPAGVPLTESLGPRLSELSPIVPCDGAALWFDRQLSQTGICPPAADIERIAACLADAGHTAVVATNELASIYPPGAAFAADVSGLMAVPLSRTPGDYLMFFRREFVRTISWAGNPHKAAELGPDDERLSPRRSFEIWRQEVRNQSKVWEPHDRLTCEALRIALLEIVLKYSELVAIERAKSASLQRLHAAEFNHRVKNALALIRALLSQSKDQHDNLQTFVIDLEGRIRSLAHAHDLASRPGMLTLRQLLETELKPFRDAIGRRVALEGPEVRLGESATSVLTLVIHELATNASKHGALSRREGRVEVRWQIEDDGSCRLVWQETGGPPVRVPQATGFGTLLISRQIPFELGGRSEISYAPDGLRAHLWLPPASFIGGGAAEDKESVAIGKDDLSPPISDLLAGRKVLLVEDSLIVALELERALRRLGAPEVFVCGTLAQALEFADTVPVQFAILDVNLKGDRSYAVADILVRRKIPFAFATGYGLDVVLPDRFSGRPVIGKPCTDREIAAAISPVLGGE